MSVIETVQRNKEGQKKPTRYYSLNHKNEQRTGRTPASTTLNEISIRIRRLFVFINKRLI